MVAKHNTPPEEHQISRFGDVSVEMGDSMACYARWEPPTAIISDGPYGLGLFPGDPPTADSLPDWYEPHVKAWTQYSLPETTLWFWCNEVGWAVTHPVLARNHWQYRSMHVWDKGVGHVAGNCNSKSIRRFPVVTEVCVQYVREVLLMTGDGVELPMKEWLRAEWLRSGLPLRATNEACGVIDAATRKYFTKCHLWYFPPPEMLERCAEYANTHGKTTDHPYFSLDGKTTVTAAQWEKMRAKWNHIHGVTNVWHAPAVRGSERIKGGMKSLHANQKPLSLVRLTIESSTDTGDVVWEPFGGLCTGAVASMQTGRKCYAAEMHPDYYNLAVERLCGESLTMKF